jgi:hypothetical protein
MVGDPIRTYHRVQTERAAAGLNMASATGIPPNVVAARGQSEEEPLLGERGDASQAEGQTLWFNLWIGMSVAGLDNERKGLMRVRHCTDCPSRNMDRKTS